MAWDAFALSFRGGAFLKHDAAWRRDSLDFGRECQGTIFEG